MGTDERTISRALAGGDKQRAAAISSMYRSKYNKSLELELKSELSGHYLKVSRHLVIDYILIRNSIEYQLWCVSNMCLGRSGLD